MKRLNFEFLTTQNIPKEKQNPVRLAWLKVLYNQIQRDHNNFIDYFELQKLEESYTAQTIALENMLNDKLDPIQRRIFIRHSQDLAKYFYSESESDFLYFYGEAEPSAVYIYEETEGSNLAVDFEIVLGFDIEGQDTFFYSESENEKLYFFNESENKPIFIFKETENKFIQEITALVNKYKASGFTFQITEL